MTFVLKAVIPKKLFRFRTVREELLRELDKQIDIIDRMYQKTYRTWTTKPTFTKTISTGKERISVTTATGFAVMRFLDDGTKVRRAVMTSDFVAKTTPRTIGSKGGRGGVIFISRKLTLPGIKARNFTKEIVKRRAKNYTKAMDRALRRGVIRTS